MEEPVISWADSVEGLPGTQSSIENIVYKIVINRYKFMSIDKIWPDTDLIKFSTKNLSKDLEFMMQDNNIIPFQISKHKKKYLIGNDHTLYEFYDGEIHAANFKDKKLVWEEALSIGDIKKQSAAARKSFSKK